MWRSLESGARGPGDLSSGPLAPSARSPALRRRAPSPRLAVLLLAASAALDRGDLRWAPRIGNESEQSGAAIAPERSTPDRPGDAAICGWFYNSIAFGAGPRNLFDPGFGPLMAEYGP
ncbi:hypothetical protein WMF04_00685 [Sorangium sp. So ce260]|uniref:hypothetical protein n=1 Tax=Sorangium sp. So ce260 TaxID=3133291 RepID=UPI003F5E5928